MAPFPCTILKLLTPFFCQHLHSLQSLLIPHMENPNEDSIQLHCSECTCAHAHATTRYSQTAPISQSLSIFRLNFTLRLPVPLLRTTLAPTSRIPSTFALSRPLVHSYPVPFYLLSPQHTGKSFPYQNTYARSFFYNFFSCGISCIRKSHKS